MARSQMDSGTMMEKIPTPIRPAPHKRHVKFPSLYQINTRILLQELGHDLGRPATLDDISDRVLDEWAGRGFDWIWFLGIWQTGLAGQSVSRHRPEWQKEFHDILPDLKEQDICGSCFAISKYEANSEFGGSSALQRMRHRLRSRGLNLLLDFVPNHTALDHHWVREHPEFYLRATEEQLEREPQNYVRTEAGGESTVLAYGRDPYFAGWPDTLQLNYAEPSLKDAMTRELLKVASQCDGVRCDMAMLVLPEVFERTWGLQSKPFWPDAIQTVRSVNPDFLFMAEVYWDLEWSLQQQGFNYTYDKRLYDRLRQGQARPVREHFLAEMDFQQKSVRFLENHDEPRAAACFPPDMHRAAAVLTFFCPGLRFFHHGQLEGRTKKVSMHLGRRPAEPGNLSLGSFYEQLLKHLNELLLRDGNWRLLPCVPAWEGNGSSDCFIAFEWNQPGREFDSLVIVVNYAPNQSQCYLRLPFDDFRGATLRFTDLMGSAIYHRDVDELCAKGLFLDLPGWGYHVFRVTTVTENCR